MKTKKTTVALFLLLLATAAIIVLQSINPQEAGKEFSEKAFFCPEDDCAGKLSKEINSSKKSVHAAIYSFTSQEIADAIIDAKARGVEVKIVTDYVQAAGKYSKDEFLKQNGIAVETKKVDGGSMHDKFIVIDNAMVATGSFNYTENANERNDENLVFLYNPEIIAGFESEFSEIWQEARES